MEMDVHWGRRSADCSCCPVRKTGSRAICRNGDSFVFHWFQMFAGFEMAWKRERWVMLVLSVPYCLLKISNIDLTYAHCSWWNIGHQRPLAIALCFGLLQCLASNCCWPLFLFPRGFQVRAWHVALDAGFLRVCPIQPLFLRSICLATGSCPACSHRSSFLNIDLELTILPFIAFNPALYMSSSTCRSW